jgi:DNA-binding Lrp family transcriptional regulator
MPTGFVLINCETSQVDYVIEQLKKIDAVKEIQGVFGMYDILTKIKVDDKDIFTKIISTQIRRIDKLKSTLTLMISNSEGDYL